MPLLLEKADSLVWKAGVFSPPGSPLFFPHHNHYFFLLISTLLALAYLCKGGASSQSKRLCSVIARVKALCRKCLYSMDWCSIEMFDLLHNMVAVWKRMENGEHFNSQFKAAHATCMPRCIFKKKKKIMFQNHLRRFLFFCFASYDPAVNRRCSSTAFNSWLEVVY